MRQKVTQVTVAGIAGLAMAVLAGCAQPPMEQFAAAEKVVESARTAGAAEYAKDEFRILEQQFALAKDELARQEKALSIFRSYTDADKLLIQVVTSGQQVEAKATENREAAKSAAVTMEKEAQQILVSAKELMVKVPVGREGTRLESIKHDLSGLEGSLSAIHQLIEKGDYIGAAAQAKVFQNKGVAVSDEIQQVLKKPKHKNKTGTHRA